MIIVIGGIVAIFPTAMFLILFKQNKIDEKDHWIQLDKYNINIYNKGVNYGNSKSKMEW